MGVGVSSSPILGCGESSTLPSPLLHEEPRDGRRTMWSGLKNALEMFHSFSMARPWSEGPLAAGRSERPENTPVEHRTNAPILR